MGYSGVFRRDVESIGRAGDRHIWADLRLDRRDRLAAQLGLPFPWAGTDEALVLAAYERWGEDCPAHLDGDFAFAVWDPPKRRFFCARDPFGVKPFYYHLSGSRFAFASDPEPVLRSPGVGRELDPSPLVDYLFGVYEDTAATPYRDVARLPAGHVLVVEARSSRCERHWRPDAVRELRLGIDAAYEEAFRAGLTEAVAARLPAAASPAGVYLSGGLDSSSVTCLAGRPLVAFSAVFDAEPRSDERGFAAAAAAQAGATIVQCQPEATSPLADWPGSPGRWPTPSCDPQAAVVRAITEGAVANGVTVLLSGFGGDFVVSHGPAYLSELARSARLGRFVTEVTAIARRHERRVWPLVRAYGLRPQLPRTVLRRRHAHQLAANGIPVRPEVAARLGTYERLADRAARAAARTAREAHLWELTSGHVALALEGSYAVDAATGVERRYPFLDRRLAELCLSLPGDQKLRDGWTRSILRRALVGVLPEVVRTRVGKADLTPAFRRSLLTGDRCALEALVARPGAVAEWVEPAGLQALWHRSQQEGASGLDLYALWRVAALAAWLDRHGFGG